MNVNKIRLFPSYGSYRLLHENATELGYSGDVNGNPIDTRVVKGLLSMNPYKPKDILIGFSSTICFYLPAPNGDYLRAEDWNINYFGILGHNFADIGGVNVELSYVLDSTGGTTPIPLVESDAMLNAEIDNNYRFSSIESTADPSFHPAFLGSPDACNGTTMVYCDYKPPTASSMLKVKITPKEGFVGNKLTLGSFVYGRYFDMPVSPDMSYKLGFTNDGVKSKRTLGGSDITDISFTSNPGFLGKYVPFSPGKKLTHEAPIGRRTWDINFSALKSDFENSPSDATGYLFPEEYDSVAESRRGNDFYNRFVKPTLGGTLPFIFQFDTNQRSSSDFYSTAEHYPIGVDKPSNFSVAKLRNRSLSFNHKSHKVYDIRMQVIESW